MKYFVPLILICLSLTQIQYSQTKKPKVTKTSISWSNILFEKWGIQSFSIPTTLLEKDETVEPMKNNDVTWTDYRKTWEKTSKIRSNSFEVNISVTNWDVDFAKVTGLKPEVATPENLINLDIIGDLNNKNNESPTVEEAKSYVLDGVNGGFTRAKWGEKKLQVLVIWQTYRYFNQKAQRLTFNVVAPRSQLATAMKILNSLKLQKDE